MDDHGTRDIFSDDEDVDPKHAKASRRQNKRLTKLVKVNGIRKTPAEAGFQKMAVRNAVTGRQNQMLECLTCQKQFAKLCNVLDHVRTHRGLRPYPCVHCKQAFAQRGNRDRHQAKRVCLIRQQQGQEEEKMF